MEDNRLIASDSFRSSRGWKTATKNLPAHRGSNDQHEGSMQPNPGVVHTPIQPDLGVVHTPIWQAFLFATVAPTMAAPFTNPFGVARTQLQAQKSDNRLFVGALDYFRKGFATEGVTALQRGITPVMMRESSMNLFRIGLYQPCLDQIHDSSSETSQAAPVSKRMVAGAIAGAIGAIACNPFEILRVRLMVQPLQTNPTNVMSTGTVFRDIWKEEGFKTFYRATGTSVALGMVCTAVNMSTYTIFREEAHRLEMKDGVAVDVSCALASGFLSALAMNPIDVVRTRMISDRTSPPEFRNGLHAARVLFRQEGPAVFMKGFVPSFLRIGPHFVITFMVLEQLRRVAHTYNSAQAEKAWYTSTFHRIDAIID